MKEERRQIKEKDEKAKQKQKERDEKAKQKQKERDEKAKQKQKERDEKAKQKQKERDEKAKQKQKERDEKEQQKQKERDEKEQQKQKERDEKAKQEQEERDKRIDERLEKLGKYIGGISHSNGEFAEEYFYNAFKQNMSFVNENFDRIKRNLSYNNGTLEAEFDLVLFNGKSAALIEIKYNAKPDNIEIDSLISRVEVFRVLFPEYAHYNIYLGVAAMSFKKNLPWRLHRAGIATIRPVGKKIVVYDKNVKVF
ncbi:MAG: hypothetical protein FWC10_01020, partial [Lentimicrobiaceae bacterium]|nr:hypothetical protein [Lentimicrobiaceae bacterium]